MKKFISIILLTFLCSCTVFHHYGTYVAQDEQYNKKAPNLSGRPSYISIPFNNTKNIDLNFGSMYEKGITWSVFVIIPIPSYTPSHYNTTLKNNTDNFSIMLYDIKNHNPEKLHISLRANGRLYTSSPQWEKYNYEYKPYIRYIFPIQIKDIGKQGTIVITYNNTTKEIPFVYDFRWTIQ